MSITRNSSSAVHALHTGLCGLHKSSILCASSRTLKRIQARAIKRILNCMCEIDALKSTPDNNTADDIPADA